MHEVDCDQQHILSCELILFGQQGMDIQLCLDDFMISFGSTCPMCNKTLVHKTTFVQVPPLLVFDLGQHIPTINHLIHITCREGHQVAYNLKRVIYYGNQDFTACVVTSTGRPGFMMVCLQEILYSTICNQWGLYTTMELLWVSTLLNSTLPERTQTCYEKQWPS